MKERSERFLDASVIVALRTNDVLTGRARMFLRSGPLALFVSDYAAAEIASVIARRVRTRALTEIEARAAFDHLDQWTQTLAQPVETSPGDIAAAAGFIRRLDLTLRAPDAINIAIAGRFGLTLATFDAGMAPCASTLGVAAAPA
jgi:predicted nucleic acid-binding protein